jgi:hypothetical protein
MTTLLSAATERCRLCPEKWFRAVRKFNACTNVWRTPGCRPGRIDHWMYMKDNAQALASYNQCSHYRPTAAHARCTP